MKERKFKITDIRWDIDGDDDVKNLLSSTTEIVVSDDEVDDLDDDEEVEDYISDTLSDKFGFCHKGFKCQEIPNR